MRLRRATAAAGVWLCCSLCCALVGAGSANAQTGYPPGPCAPAVSLAAGGSVAVGSTFTVVLAPICVWTPGTAVTVAVNGLTVATKTATASGTVTVTVRALSSSTLEIDDPVTVPAVCGTNTVAGTGASTVAGLAVTHTVSFVLVCPATVVASRTTAGALAFTGANLIRWSLVAIALLLAGVVIVSTVRKRRRTRESVAV